MSTTFCQRPAIISPSHSPTTGHFLLKYIVDQQFVYQTIIYSSFFVITIYHKLWAHSVRDQLL